MNKLCPVKISLLTTALASTALAQTPAIPVPLTHNFNGIVHAGEAGVPDDPVGFRSISDRALDFQAGVPNDPLLNNYTGIVATAGALDIVHLGNRNTVDNSSKAFGAVADGDNFGTQPLWLTDPDQTGPQTTTLATPMPISSTTEAAFLYQISNGGGTFDVTFTLASGGNFTGSLSGPDWFNGAYAGMAGVDNAVSDNNLSITEGRINLGAFDGDTVTAITFENRGNPQAGYAILACNFEYPPEPSRLNQIALNYNFNGVVHAGEAGLPDDLIGYRSISDRGLDFQNGVPADPSLDAYALIDLAGAFDMVHLGNRNNNWPFDLTANGDNIGVQPAWLIDPDQTTPQVTTLTDGIIMDVASSASFIAQGTDGGGMIDVEFQFATGAPLVQTVQINDWFGGSLPGTAGNDQAISAQNLNVTEVILDLSAQAGRVLTAISFQNIQAGPTSNFGILAMNVTGCANCNNGATAAVTNLGGGVGATMSTTANGNLGCTLDWTVAGATPNSIGLWAVGLGTTPVPISLVFPACAGTVFPDAPVFVTAFADGAGSATIDLPLPVNQAICGTQITGQHAELDFVGACLTILSDAIEFTIGN